MRYLSQILLLATLVASLHAWWDVGHMLTAAVAQIKLQREAPLIWVKFEDVTTSINQLCNNKSQTVIESASWPDDIKGTGQTIWNDWHFIDSPYVYDGVNPILNYTQNISNSVSIVNEAKRVLSLNTDMNLAERALFARYLIHLAGDIHQPLHSVALFNRTLPKGDQGGNLLRIKLLNGSISNFHSFWDAGAYYFNNNTFDLPRPLSRENTTTLMRMAADIMAEFDTPEVQALGNITDPAIWAMESFFVAMNTTYPLMLVSDTATEKYVKDVYYQIRKRIALGGLRLANTVVEVYSKGFEADKQPKRSEAWFQEQIKDRNVVAPPSTLEVAE